VSYADDDDLAPTGPAPGVRTGVLLLAVLLTVAAGRRPKLSLNIEATSQRHHPAAAPSGARAMDARNCRNDPA
jgi:hypothetical protein